MTMARISANRIIGGVSLCREMSPGNSANGWGRSERPRISHPMNVTAIHNADPGPQGDDEPGGEKGARNEPVRPERHREAARQRDRESRQHQPAPAGSADAK